MRSFTITVRNVQCRLRAKNRREAERVATWVVRSIQRRGSFNAKEAPAAKDESP